MAIKLSEYEIRHFYWNTLVSGSDMAAGEMKCWKLGDRGSLTCEFAEGLLGRLTVRNPRRLCQCDELLAYQLSKHSQVVSNTIASTNEGD